MTSSGFLSGRSNHRPKHLPFIFLFISFFALGFSTYKNYGLSFDETEQRDGNGIFNFNYIVHGDYSTLIKGTERYHGSAFEIVLVFSEKAFNVTDSREIYLIRHLLTFISFAIAVLFFYLICVRFLKNENIGIIGCACLILSPRIFAESFYNSKDLAFLSFMIINIYTALRFAERKTFVNTFFHSVVTAFTMDIRVTGIIIPILSILLLVTDFFLDHENKKIKIVLTGCLYLALTCGFVILLWPVLWRNPIQHFLSAFAEMSHYDWKGNVLYRGEFISSTNLPWHYIPVWLFITTPILYLFLFFSGIAAFIKTIFKGGFMQLIKSTFMIVNLSVFFIPLFAVIFLHSVVYDSWRHLYFIYPSFLFIGLFALQKIFAAISTKRTAKICVYGVLFISFLNTSFAMIKLHPYENVYFNSFAGKDMKDIKTKFEMDYWGLSNKDGLNYILDHDTTSIVKILSDNYSGQVSYSILTKDRRDRIRFTSSIDDADYFISNFRWHPEEFSTEKEFYSVHAGNAKIFVVYKVTPSFISFYNKSKWHY